MCLQGEPVGKGDQFIPHLRADILAPRASFSGCLEKAGGAAVRFWGARSTPLAHSEPPCLPLLLIVLALRMWLPKGELHVAHLPRFLCRSKLHLLGVGTFGSSEAL